jgi:hypothetical protein
MVPVVGNVTLEIPPTVMSAPLRLSIEADPLMVKTPCPTIGRLELQQTGIQLHAAGKKLSVPSVKVPLPAFTSL